MPDKPDRPADSYPSNPWPLIIVVAVVLAAVVFAALGFWRRSALLFAAALGLGAVLRLVLPRRIAGLLVVRRRWIDVTVMAVMAIATAAIAFIVPGS
ncbi:DUF3017 domain-containing protein [Tessaracoccus flavescens]|uniref:DUF3017 domain-containing protein n=1 Tax=Tessaracoccus flavescens TaxID=399497 RepID=A0A1Q2D004_9ACTN|nr:DUF3017 domain-containing protein [Tessaracoccus flavescens]AQP51632.1 hypothetical protein BW733_13190 [Tessaracoccus flavescens]